MNEKPILFTAEMVRAVLDGRKTQTRRIVKFKDKINPGMMSDDGWPIYHDDFSDEVKQTCPYGAVGDELWVRETHCYCDILNKGYLMDDPVTVGYRSDKGACEYQSDSLYKLDTYAWNWEHDSIKWRPSIHMPRWASRIQLRITGVRVERVQEITEDDCKREGVDSSDSDYGNLCQNILDNCGPHSHDVERNSADIACFKKLWDSINEKRGYGWDKNPHVWCVEFEVVK